VTDRESMVYIVDDDESVRAALADLLESVSLQVRTFGSPLEFLDAQLPDLPACLVLDIRMPGMSGLEFQRQMADMGLDIPVIFITAHGDIPMCVQAMKAGAIDFLSKPFRDQDLIDAIQLGIEMDRGRRRDHAEMQKLQRGFDGLSNGEREVLMMVAQGMLNKQIAARLNLSEITVKVRRRQIKDKLGVNSVAELARIVERLEKDVDAGEHSAG